MENKDKKKIAIVAHWFGVFGGIEIALINLLKSIDSSRYEVTLFAYDEESLKKYIGEIPKNIKIIYTKPENTVKIMAYNLKKLRLIRVFKGLWARMMLRIEKNEIKRFFLMFLCFTDYKEKYDIAIAFHSVKYTTPEIFANINAKKVAIFCHAMEFLDTLSNKKFYKYARKSDKIFCVSTSLKNEIDNKYPKLNKKTEVCYNIISKDDIFAKSLEKSDVDFEAGVINLVTVGRLNKIKGQYMIPKITRLLLDEGYDVKWYLVGEGERQEIESQKYGVSENVILLGAKSNPYPYIKNCDIYVQTSFSEGYCTTTMEAKILRKPIVTTDAPGMREQFASGENGLIVDAMTPESLFEGIKTLIDSPELCKEFIENLSNEQCDNVGELEKIYRLIED